MDMFMVFEIGSVVFANTILLAHILLTENCTGISGKTQILYWLIHLFRFTELLTAPTNINHVRSLVIGFTLLALAFATTLSIFYCYPHSYQSQHDTFRLELVIMPCLILAIMSGDTLNTHEMLMTFTIFLEAVAILPQLQLIANSKGSAKSIIVFYITALAIHTIFTLTRGIRQFYIDEPCSRMIMAAQIIQLMFYFDFFVKGEAKDNKELDEDKNDVVMVVVEEKKNNCQDEKKCNSVNVNDVHAAKLNAVNEPNQMICNDLSKDNNYKTAINEK